MFKVLTNRARPRLTSPRFVVASVIAHLWIALAVATVMKAEPAPEPEPQTQIIEFPIDPPTPPAKPDPMPPAPVDPSPAPVAGDNVALRPPVDVPDGVKPEAPGTTAQLPDPGFGRPGDYIGTPPEIVTPPTGNTDPPTDYSGPIPESMADVRPSLANSAEAGRLLERNYPPSFADAGISGRTVVEVIVEANGRVRPGSARIVETSNEQFGDATLRIIERLRFRPARVGNQPIAVIVQVPIDWRAAH